MYYSDPRRVHSLISGISDIPATETEFKAKEVFQSIIFSKFWNHQRISPNLAPFWQHLTEILKWLFCLNCMNLRTRNISKLGCKFLIDLWQRYHKKNQYINKNDWKNNDIILIIMLYIIVIIMKNNHNMNQNPCFGCDLTWLCRPNKTKRRQPKAHGGNPCCEGRWRNAGRPPPFFSLSIRNERCLSSVARWICLYFQKALNVLICIYMEKTYAYTQKKSQVGG